jgi:hypothetical protein
MSKLAHKNVAKLIVKIGIIIGKSQSKESEEISYQFIEISSSIHCISYLMFIWLSDRKSFKSSSIRLSRLGAKNVPFSKSQPPHTPHIFKRHSVLTRSHIFSGLLLVVNFKNELGEYPHWLFLSSTLFFSSCNSEICSL